MNDDLPDISRLAGLLADPGRSRMLLALLEGLRAEVQRLGLAHAKSEVAPVVTISLGVAWLVPQPHQSLADALRRELPGFLTRDGDKELFDDLLKPAAGGGTGAPDP